jgi:5'-3' exonuclease
LNTSVQFSQLEINFALQNPLHPASQSLFVEPIRSRKATQQGEIREKSGENGNR